MLPVISPTAVPSSPRLSSQAKEFEACIEDVDCIVEYVQHLVRIQNEAAIYGFRNVTPTCINILHQSGYLTLAFSLSHNASASLYRDEKHGPFIIPLIDSVGSRCSGGDWHRLAYGETPRHIHEETDR
jgi:hypothetical protein